MAKINIQELRQYSQLNLIAPYKITTILISVSGGRTSGYMAYWMINNKDEVAKQLGIAIHDLKYIFVFANTGLEHDDSLRFMYDTAKNIGFNCVWVEGVTHHFERKSTTHKIVNFDSAARYDSYENEEHPFHSHIKKYGVPNISYKNCTRELKRNAINSYMKSINMDEKKHFYTAIGIREDESRRCSKNAAARNLIYPLVDWHPVDEKHVLEFWKKYEWDLKIPRHLGNCVTCFEKCQGNLNKAYVEEPSAFKFNLYMEQRYGTVGPEFLKYDDAVPRVFFRNRTGAKDLIANFKI